VVESEDKRFFEHAGVDVLAVARAVAQNVTASRVVSGASTITMQLMRMLHHPRAERTLARKAQEAVLALAAERAFTKEALLEAYLNHAYYGRGAYGIAEAARTYFGKAPRALTDGEATLLAVLPRAPRRYDPRTHLDAALRRRAAVLAMLLEANAIDAAQRASIEARTLVFETESTEPPFEAPHFVDWLLADGTDHIDAAELRAGGVLATSLDLDLQRALERMVRSHVDRLAHRGIRQAGVVVLDAQTSDVLAMVGSTQYASGQLNLAVRRRHPGSVLKPFVYALALERGLHPSSITYDVGDVPSGFRSRDWVGREGGPMPLTEALAGSYNLAAVHTLETVGIEALRDRLRAIGVAEVSLPPQRYGLQLALGSARVALLDVTAGLGFTVRGGLVRSAGAVRALHRRGRPRPLRAARSEVRAFSPQISWLVMDMLSSPAARHRRFGRGLPIEGNAPHTPSARVVAKTGTASGLSDLLAVLASEQFLVGAWAGRFDGRASQGMSGMWAAAPLARQALDLALRGRAPTLPEAPDGITQERVCAVSGMHAGPACPDVRDGYALAGSPSPACTWHDTRRDGVEAPSELSGWLARARAVRFHANEAMP
jgi:penicillin-binding protein 1C